MCRCPARDPADDPDVALHGSPASTRDGDDDDDDDDDGGWPREGEETYSDYTWILKCHTQVLRSF